MSNTHETGHIYSFFGVLMYLTSVGREVLKSPLLLNRQNLTVTCVCYFNVG